MRQKHYCAAEVSLRLSTTVSDKASDEMGLIVLLINIVLDLYDC